MNISISNAIQSSAISGGGEPSALPLALDLSITGGFAIGSVQTGNYTYFDPNTVAESGTTFKWYSKCRWRLNCIRYYYRYTSRRWKRT